MRRVLVCSLLVLTLAGCGASGSTSTATSPVSSPSSGGDSSTPSSDPGGGGAGCSSLSKTELADFIVGTQLIAQVRDKDALAGITSGTIGQYTPESYGAILAKMSFLTGSGAEGVAKLTAANDAVKKLASGSPTQADFDAYQQQTGGVSGLIKAQVAVNMALVQACPNLG